MQRIAHSKKKNLSFVTSMLNSSRTTQGTCLAFNSFRKAHGTWLAFRSSIQSIGTNSSDIITNSYLRFKILPFVLHYPSTPLKILSFFQFNAMNKSCKSFSVYSCFSSNVIQHNSYAHFSKSWNHLMFCPPFENNDNMKQCLWRWSLFVDNTIF